MVNLTQVPGRDCGCVNTGIMEVCRWLNIISRTASPNQSVNPSPAIHDTCRLFSLLFTYWQGSHRLEKYLNLEGFLEKSLKIKSTLKSTGKSLKSLERALNSSFFCRTKHC